MISRDGTFKRAVRSAATSAVLLPLLVMAQDPAPTPYPTPEWVPGAGGSLPEAPIFTANPGEVGLLTIGRTHRRNKAFIFGNEHPTQAEIELRFPSPNTIGATHYCPAAGKSRGIGW